MHEKEARDDAEHRKLQEADRTAVKEVREDPAAENAHGAVGDEHPGDAVRMHAGHLREKGLDVGIDREVPRHDERRQDVDAHEGGSAQKCGHLVERHGVAAVPAATSPMARKVMRQPR